MIRQRYYINVKGEKWGITLFLPLTCYHVREIMQELDMIECNREDMQKAWKNLTSGQLNNGLTFSNYELRQSVVVLALADSPMQYFNLIVHELHHLSVQIGIASGFDLTGEEVCYINGDVAMMMFPLVRKLFCR